MKLRPPSSSPRFEFVGLVEHMPLSLCALYFAMNLTTLFRASCAAPRDAAAREPVGAAAPRAAPAAENRSGAAPGATWTAKNRSPEPHVPPADRAAARARSCQAVPRCARASELVDRANALDAEVYVAGCEIFWRRVGEIERATGVDLSAVDQ